MRKNCIQVCMINLFVLDPMPAWSVSRLQRLVKTVKRHTVDPQVAVQDHADVKCAIPGVTRRHLPPSEIGHADHPRLR